jgi:hypothetical protein
MEFTFTFAEIINKIIDLSLLGMESFIAIWLFAAFVSSAYPDSISSPATPTTPVAAAPVQESATIEPAPDVAATINELNCKSLRPRSCDRWSLRETGRVCGDFSSSIDLPRTH